MQTATTTISVPSPLRNSVTVSPDLSVDSHHSDPNSPETTTAPPMPPTIPPAPAKTQHVPPETLKEMEKISKQFELDQAKLKAIVERFVWEFKEGLDNYGKDMAMVPTFVTGVPNGTEVGTFLALDLGGTNLRVCEVNLEGNNKFSLRQQKYKVSTELKTGEATALFDYMAESVDHFLTDRDIAGDEALHLGLTFSFPVEQSALDRGTLLTWTKGFAAKNAIGNDVVKLLQDAFNRKHLHVKCTALVNDTVGALMSRAYLSGDCLLGAIFGTGTNGAFVESMANIRKLGNLSKEQTFDKMIVNTEWGAFDNTRNVLPVTQFDNKVDRESINPRKQLFEKFISGMYQGEICRNLILYLIDNGFLLDGYSTELLNRHYGFDSALMSMIETPVSETAQNATDATHPNSSAQAQQTRAVFVEHLGFRAEQITDVDAEIILWACKTVATRAARLSGAAIAAVMKQTGHIGEGVDVGVDGSLAELYPGFEGRVREALREVVGETAEQKVVIGLAKDGSGVGAALGALQAKKQAEALAKQNGTGAL